MVQCINPSYLVTDFSVFPTASLLPEHAPTALLVPLRMAPAALQVLFLTGR